MADRDPPALADPIRARVLSEALEISASAQFARAPMMQRLLNFLVTETLAGRGDQLKAYAVAVDGLGRPADFDARSDSYPRVQVGRLRKLLDGHYEHRLPADGLRLHIPQGGYRVTLVKGVAAAECKAATMVARRFPSVRHWLIAAVVAAALLGLLAMRAWKNHVLNNSIVPPPSLYLARIVAPGMEAGARDALRATLLDGLGRSDMIRLATQRPGETFEAALLKARYGLGANVTTGKSPTLFLRLWRVEPDRLIWSDKIVLPDDPADYAEALAPFIATIAQPLGAIAVNERAEAGADLRPGYPCLLSYHGYRANRAPELALVRECVQRTLALDPAHAPALAVASALVLEDELFSSVGPPQKPPRLQALLLARRAVSADPFDARAHMSLARASLFNNACTAASRSALRATALNPYDPTLLIRAGIYLLDCSHPGAEALLKRAVMLDPNTPVYNTPFVYLALARGDGRQARAAAMRMEQAPMNMRDFYYLTIAIALAADGDQAGARRAWTELEKIRPEVAKDPVGLLRRWHYSPRILANSIAALSKAGLVPPPQPASRRDEAEALPKR